MWFNLSNTLLLLIILLFVTISIILKVELDKIIVSTKLVNVGPVGTSYAGSYTYYLYDETDKKSVKYTGVYKSNTPLTDGQVIYYLENDFGELILVPNSVYNKYNTYILVFISLSSAMLLLTILNYFLCK